MIQWCKMKDELYEILGPKELYELLGKELREMGGPINCTEFRTLCAESNKGGCKNGKCALKMSYEKKDEKLDKTKEKSCLAIEFGGVLISLKNVSKICVSYENDSSVESFAKETNEVKIVYVSERE